MVQFKLKDRNLERSKSIKSDIQKEKEKYKDKHNAELQRADPGTKVMG